MRLDFLLSLPVLLVAVSFLSLLNANDVCDSDPDTSGTCSNAAVVDSLTDQVDIPARQLHSQHEEDYEEDDDYDGDEDYDYDYFDGDDDTDDFDYDDDQLDPPPPRQEQVLGSENAPKTTSPEILAKRYGVEQSRKGYDPSYLVQVDEYWNNVVLKEEGLNSIREHCQNKDPLCTFWATLGECEENPAYMQTNCGPACFTCHKLIFEERCPFDREATPDAWKAGDLNKFFERITTDPFYEQYNTTVICKPGMPNPLKGDCPWIVTMDGFITDHECDTLIEQGALLGYERSEDVGERNPDGSYGSVKSSGRTSTNAWCSDHCMENATVLGVLERIETMTGIPDANSEFLQLLRYEVGQFYESHHDYIDHDTDRSQGPRILTVFLYLNDVEAGGATHFTDLNISVSPKRGRVLIWPSVIDSDPSKIERRTHHQAKPVESGIKYGANTWIHLRNFKKPYEQGCT